MHQTPRNPPKVASPASSPQTNPTRTNNPREGLGGGGHSRAGSEASGHGAPASPDPNALRAEGGPSRDSIKKLDQIIQNVYLKAMTVIVQERMKVAPLLVGRSLEKRTSKWFQLDTVDIDDFRDEAKIWKQCGGFENRPPPMIIETYLDTSRLKSGQCLVVLDENGRRFDVVEALNSSDLSSDTASSRAGQQTSSLVVLERWRIELRGSVPQSPEEFGPILPTIYKKAIVMFRSLYTSTGILPAWKLARNSKTKGIHPSLLVRCRLLAGDSQQRGIDPLRIPLYESPGDVATDFMLGDLETPVGRFYVSVAYRNHSSFQVVDSEELMSSRLGIGISDDLFRPSLAHRGHTRHESSAEIGSLPTHRQIHDITENSQRYGSLSTFHGEGPTGTSPISALRAVKAPGSDVSSPAGSVPASMEAVPHSLPISGQGRLPLRGAEGIARRPSVSFQPFKHGSLSGSPVPRLVDYETPSSPGSVTRGSGTSALNQPRNRSSLTAGMPASLRGGPPPAETPSTVGSPKPSVTSRYSSSFTHRRSRASFGGTSRAGDDDQASSGKQSLSSSVAQPGSGLLNEAGAGGSSGSFPTDDDNISEFLKALDSKRTLQSFEPNKKGESASKKTVAQLSKFQLMRDSNNALGESMTSSMALHRSSSSSSRQLTNVPGMSTSASPGKPLSPHTPHTPAIPSRLSENSSIDYTAPQRGMLRGEEPLDVEVPGNPAPAAGTQEGTTAIAIPISPRPYAHARRSSSVAQEHRNILDDDDEGGVHRSMSMGADGREPLLTISGLVTRGRASDDGAVGASALQPAADIQTTESSEMLRTGSSSMEREARPPPGLVPGLSSSPYRRRYGGSTGRGLTPPQSGSGSLVAPSGRYSSHSRSGPGGAGTSTAVPDDADEEPLLFDMSEIGRDMSRRSIEEGRGGGSVGSGGERGGFDSSRGSSRRGAW